MMPWRRHLTRTYGSRDLKCFVGILMLLAVAVVGLIIRSQILRSDGDIEFNFDDYMDDRLHVRQDTMFAVDEDGLHHGDGGFPGELPLSSDDYLKEFKSPYLVDKEKEIFRDLKLTREDKKDVTSNKLITWYDMASTQIREDLFDDSVFDVCPVHRCKFMRPEMMGEKLDRQVDAIIFPGVAGRDRDPPRREHPDQVFIYYDMEAPVHPVKAFGSPAWNSVFNWTWSYRRDADIWQPAGFLQRQDKVKPSTYLKDVVKNKNRKKPVAWFANNCHTPSGRERYVRDLQQYIHVDVYGQCGNLTCPMSFACLQMLSTKYFFYLSFESALCKDYVTDKFLHMFYPDISLVPIVLGGANYDSLFPQGTYIDASWFATPKDLADFLNYLMDEKKTYTEFLWRKTHLEYSGSSTDSALCQLCHRLHSLRTSRRTYPDFQLWYRADQCRAPKY